ncbi:hypothetical protein BH11ACT7_BH11ACT7_40010 [soil metagenome]
MTAQPTNAPRRGRPPSGDKRGAILSAARELLVERGYAATSIPEIVKRAGVAQGTFYRYFDSKAQLVEALSLQLQQEIQDGLDAAITKCGPDKPVTMVIADLISAALQVMQRYEDIYPFLSTEALLFGSSPAAARQRAGYVAVLAELITRDQSTGLVPADVDPQLTAALIGAILDHTARVVASPKTGRKQRRHTIDQAIRFITRALQTA